MVGDVDGRSGDALERGSPQFFPVHLGASTPGETHPRSRRDRAEIWRHGPWRDVWYDAQAMARMGRLPSALAAEASPERTPAAALLVSSCAIILLLSMPFTELLELDMSLYAAALGLELLALLRLRWTEPHLHRPFEVYPLPPDPFNVVFPIYVTYSRTILSDRATL